MPVRLPIRLAALAALVLTAGCVGRGAVETQPGRSYIAGSGVITTYAVAERRMAPTPAGTTLDGRRLDLADYRGKVVVLNFWASWCPPCRDEAPGLAQLARDTAARGVRFVGIDLKDDLANARAFVATHKTPYPSLFDRYGQLTVQFGRSVPPQSVPTTLVVDRTGRVAASVYGAVTYDRLRTLVEQALAGPRAGGA